LGHLGKEKMRIIGFLSYRQFHPAKIAAAALCASLAACSTTQTFTGSLQPQAGTCDVLNRATLQRQGHIIQFTPQDGVMVLDGTLSTTGQITAAQQTLGMDRKPYRLTFTGQLTGDTIQGNYVSPRCRYSVTLKLADS
jgi:hypothetical protein